MKIPYTDLQLKIALMSIPEDERTLDRIKSVSDKVAAAVPNVEDKVGLNKAVADSNGITISELLASVNYQLLVTAFVWELANKLHDGLVEEGFSDKQAWSIAALGMGLLEVKE